MTLTVTIDVGCDENGPAFDDIDAIDGVKHLLSDPVMTDNGVMLYFEVTNYEVANEYF